VAPATAVWAVAPGETGDELVLIASRQIPVCELCLMNRILRI
jgi:hypothetical protein